MVTLFTGSKLGLKVHVFGPETHMTAIVGMALKRRPIPQTSSEPQTMALLGAPKLSSVSYMTDCVNHRLLIYASSSSPS